MHSEQSHQPERVSDMTLTEAFYPQLDGRVLVVEDNPTNQLVLSTLLPKLGLQTTLAENGQKAVDLIVESGHDFDVILMDLQMPIMDGYEATGHIRAWEKAKNRPPISIIALTADAFPDDRKHCLSIGMNDFIAKPILIEDLLQALGHRLAAPSSIPFTARSSAPDALRSLDVPRFLEEAIALLPLLEQGKFDVIDRFADLELLAANTVQAEVLRPIRKMLDAFRFSQAQAALTQLLDTLPRQERRT